MRVEIYDPAMCCPTGVCGPAVDPELVRVNETALALGKQDVDVKRFNLAQQPGDFMANRIISELLQKDGNKVLPITLVNGELFRTGDYPAYEELCEALGIEPMRTRPVLLKR